VRVRLSFLLPGRQQPEERQHPSLARVVYLSGAEAERARHDQARTSFPDFDFHQEWARSRQRSQSRQEAFQAARARAAGKTREEIKALYIAELRSRNLKIPEGDVLDAIVDALTGHYVTAARLIGRSVADLWKFLRPPR
jgi:hypothetical protein